MELKNSMKWFSVRMIFKHKVDSPCKPLYEERILVYRSYSVIDVIIMAEQDISEYISMNPGFSKVGPIQIFSISKSIDELHRSEVWSKIVHGEEDSDVFYHDRYEKFELID